MELTQKQLDKFKHIYNEQFHEEIDDDKAKGLGKRLIKLVEIVIKK